MSETKMRVCKACKQEKVIEAFRVDHSWGGYGPYQRNKCKVCESADAVKRQSTPEGKAIKRNNRFLQNYNLTSEQVDGMIARQGGRCAICSRTPEPDSLGRTLRVDHCHDTDKVREMLCNLCNTALGKFKDDVDILQNAITYLEEHNDT